MPRTKLEEIIESFEIKEFSQFFRLKTQVEGNFRPSDERLSQYDDADFFDFVRLGQIEFFNTQKLLVVGAKVNRDLSERTGKKAQYEKAKKMLRELSAYSAGIFIYYDKSGNFRFSLIYPESAGTKLEWSNFRRFTYFVSKELTNKTFLQRIGDGNFSTLGKIKDAFSVEKVTKEFYLEYRKLFDSLMEDLSKNHTFLNEASKNQINTENFAKKLLGQIVFLYFIQKKGWLGVPAGKRWGEGDKNFMGNIYKEAMSKEANFYNDYLEKLFYNALNNPHRDSTDPSFSKDFNSRIPFLNGGLFEAEYNWEDSLMYLDNKIFQVIFDVFERYNFTIEEESPDDKEIAVDPEMLGKVFENLLPENLRKGKGTYYTPRKIVYYMCRESLVNYLVSNHSNITEENIRNYIFYSESFENFKKQKGESFTPGQWKELDDLLASIRVCDPACGSGAFLVGMLNMIIKLRIFLQTTPDSHLIQQKKEYELKRETIQNCIYGVDIDPGAIEIAKLRLWLALVVDYDLEDIEPLPNLDYRLMCGNSLLEEFEGVKFYNGENEMQATLLQVDPEKQKKVEMLEKKVKEYFSIHDDKEKLKKRKEINDIKDWLIGTALEKRRRELVSQHKGAEAKANMLDEKSRQKYLAGFDKWLGSSTNIQKALESLHNPKKEKPFFIWKLEFIDVFEEKSGFDVVIANPPYVNLSNLSSEDREAYKRIFTVTKNKVDLYAFFIERGSQILKDEGVLTYIVPHTWEATTSFSKLRQLIFNNFEIKTIVELDYGAFEATVKPVVIILYKHNVQDYQIPVLNSEFETINKIDLKEIAKNSDFAINTLSTPVEKILFRKIEASTIPLEEVCKFTRGIKTSNDNKFVKQEASNNEYKKVIRGRNVGKYFYEWGGKYVWYRPDLMKEKVGSLPHSKELFEVPEKLILQRISRGLAGCYDDKRMYALDTCLVSDSKTLRKNWSIKFILALINSRLLNFWYYKKFVLPTVSGYELHQLPIKQASLMEQRRFTNFVDKILVITRSNDYLEDPAKQAKVSDYEKQIDQLVYKLYGLTPKEVEIIEG